MSHEEMERLVEKIYEQFDDKRKKQEAIDADILDLEELKAIEDKLKKK